MKRNLIIAVLMTIVVSANAMTSREARVFARTITDKMAYELRLTDRQYREVYKINLRYIDNPVAKNRKMAQVLTMHQYDKYLRMYGSHVHVMHHPIHKVAVHHPSNRMAAHRPSPVAVHKTSHIRW
ncbi:MAG: hypothetical protein IJ604_02990 [Prevotella sp.]|nr:hypothetical protein [Prevotella sp.]MBR1462330.1 hypothetical protein [Prevotella sp.]